MQINFLPTCIILSFFALALTHGCASTPPIRQETPAERMERDSAVGLELAVELEKSLQFRQEEQVSLYLANLARKLADATPELHGTPLVVRVVRDDQAKWRSFSLPGGRIYLSVGILKALEFESQLAGLIATELGHILRSHVAEQLRAAKDPAVQESPLRPSQPPRSVTFFGASGVFNYREQAHKEAIETAVHILYNSGYDPRGVASLLAQYEKNQKFSPYEASTLVRLREYSRHLIAQNAPLLNPIVRSAAFLMIQERMRKL